MFISPIQYPKTKSLLQITNNTSDNMPMWDPRNFQELLTTLTTYEILGSVIVRSSYFPISRQYLLASSNNSPSSFISFWFGFIETSTRRAPKKPIASNKSSSYFLLNKFMPVQDLTTSIPRKYLSLPKSLVWSYFYKNCFNIAIHPESFLMITISFRYATSRI